MTKFFRAIAAAEGASTLAKALRERARENARQSEDRNLRRALRLAEAGYGVAQVVAKSGVETSVASMLVLGK